MSVGALKGGGPVDVPAGSGRAKGRREGRRLIDCIRAKIKPQRIAEIQIITVSTVDIKTSAVIRSKVLKLICIVFVYTKVELHI